MSERFYWRCDAGHQAISIRPLGKCQAYVRGVPCKAVLRRTTPGGNLYKEKSSTVEATGTAKARPKDRRKR